MLLTLPQTTLCSLYEANDKVDKLTLTLDVTDTVLKKYGVKPSVQEKELIRIIVEQSIEYAEKTV